MPAQRNLFWEEDRNKKRQSMGPNFLQVRDLVDWESFRATLKEALGRDLDKGGRPAYDCVMMFRIVVLQDLYQLSDDEMEFQLYDRKSFQHFVGILNGDRIPDAKTIWLFKDQLSRYKTTDKRLFEDFQGQLAAAGYHARGGQIMDASIHDVRRPRSTDPQDYKTASSQAQHDTDARFTKKGGQSFFGYKNHINIDRTYKLVREYEATPANLHDSQCFEELIDPQNSALDIWADSAYKSQKHDELCETLAYRNKIHHRAYHNKPLTGHQRRSNKARSRVRALVEHTFAYGKNWGKKITIRGIGLKRATLNIGLKNLTYNMRRFLFLEKQREQCA